MNSQPLVSRLLRDTRVILADARVDRRASAGCRAACRDRRSAIRRPACRIRASSSSARRATSVTPVGGANTCRAIGLPMSQTSRLTTVQNTIRAPFGSFSGGRSTIAEKSARSRGSIGLPRGFFPVRFAIPASSFLESTFCGRDAKLMPNRLAAITANIRRQMDWRQLLDWQQLCCDSRSGSLVQSQPR